MNRFHDEGWGEMIGVILVLLILILGAVVEPSWSGR